MEKTFHKIKLTLLALLCSAGLMAENAWDAANSANDVNTNFFYAVFDAETGCLYLQSCILMNYNGWGYQGMYGSNHQTSLTCGSLGLNVKFYTDKGFGKGVDMTGTTSLVLDRSIYHVGDQGRYPNTLPQGNTKTSDSGNWITLYNMWISVPQSAVNNPYGTLYSLNYNGRWGSNDDTKFNHDRPVNVWLSESTMHFSLYGSKTSPSGDPYVFDWANTPRLRMYYCPQSQGDGSRSDWSQLGRYYLYDVDADKRVSEMSNYRGAWLSNAASNQSDYFEVYWTQELFKEAHTLTIEHSYEPNLNKAIHYTSQSDTRLTIPAYPQVKEGTLVVKPELEARQLNINFSLDAAPTQNVISDSINVNVHVWVDNQHRDTTLRVLYVPGQVDYSLNYPMPADMDSAHYQVKAYRTFEDVIFSNNRTTFRDAFVKTSPIGTYSVRHVVATSLTSSVEQDGNNAQKMVLRWNHAGALWTRGSKAILTRYDQEQENLPTTISIDDVNEFYRGYYVDDNIRSCHNYRYTLQVKPGSSAYTAVDPVLTEDYQKILSNPRLLSFEASQGEFSDKVELRFMADPMNAYFIERRPLGEAAWQTILSTSTTSATRQYMLVDNYAGAGIIYEYRLRGQHVCGGDTTFIEDKTMVDFGFRRPSGDIYGRVTFEDGTSVDSVDVRMQPTTPIQRHCLHFSGTPEVASISDSLLGSAPLTLQVVARSTGCVHGTLVEIPGLVAIEVNNDEPHAVLNGQMSLNFRQQDTINAQSLINKYMALTVVITNDSVFTYMDGVPADTASLDGVVFDYQHAAIAIGKNWVGDLDELRLFNRALTGNEISATYDRFLVGNEDGLVGYYNFDFGVQGFFFDQSFRETATGAVFNRHHGTYIKDATPGDEKTGTPATLPGITYAPSQLPLEQLTYAGMTNASGVYQIRCVPYYGNGTAYTITPIKGVHQFLPTEEVRFLSNTTANHTVNFTDNSSFEVPIKIVFRGSELPVEGVNFEVDGTVSTRGSGIVKTDAEGKATLRVPIGVHRVQAKMQGHDFVDDGRLLDVRGNDLNYQEHLATTTLYDTTRVLVIGRVVGGRVQADYPVGFGLSTNNLSSFSTVELTPIKSNYVVSIQGEEQYVQHHPLKRDSLRYQHRFERFEQNVQMENHNDHKTRVTYSADKITIHVDSVTGEFFAWVPPVSYQVNVRIPGQSEEYVGKIEGNHTELDLSLKTNSSDHSTLSAQRDSVVYADSTFSSYSFDDQIPCAAVLRYTLRLPPLLTVVQQHNGEDMAYFGSKTLVSTYENSAGLHDTLLIWNNPDRMGYYFGRPVFEEKCQYDWLLRLSEDYQHTEKGTIDHVGCENVRYSVTNTMVQNTPVTYVGDSATGEFIYQFVPGEPNMVTALQSVGISAIYGNANNATSVAWTAPFAQADGQLVYNLGGHKQGNDFVTQGPHTVLTVLRDPPGSTSYSYLNTGTSFNASQSHAGSECIDTKIKFTSAAGVEAYVIAVVEMQKAMETSVTFGTSLNVSEKYTGTKTFSRTCTTTQKIQTSSSPDYVGAMADVYVGYSSNVIFGACDQMMLVSRDYYLANQLNIQHVYSPETDPWILVSKSALSIGDTISTTFVYTQKQIIEQEMPKILELRNQLLTIPTVDFPTDSARLAQEVLRLGHTDDVYYLSRLTDVDDPHFGQKGYYATIYNVDTVQKKRFISQEVYYNDSLQRNDTIILFAEPNEVEAYNTSWTNWRDRIADNEKVKFKAKSFKNYSFDAGTSISYDETYTSTRSFKSQVDVLLGVTRKNDTKVDVVGSGIAMGHETNVTGGYGYTNSTQATRTHSKGFVLSDNSYGDYFSVDVCREPTWKEKDEEYNFNTQGGNVSLDDIDTLSYYSSFIFKTVAGATSCPCERAEYSIFYKENGENVLLSNATLQRDKPQITVLTPNVENVPSGDVAFVQVQFENAGEGTGSRPYDVKMDQNSNPLGAEITMDGQSLGQPVTLIIPEGGKVVKTLAVRRASAMEYKDLCITLLDKCPTVNHDTYKAYFSVQFVPGCTGVEVTQPAGVWTYNTLLPTQEVGGLKKHYLATTISGFNANYENFDHISLQRKSRNEGDDAWVNLRTWTKTEIDTIGASLSYNMFMDDRPDGDYDLRAVAVCMVNGEAIETPSAIREGVKDMVPPQQYGVCHPASGILTAEEEISVSFSEPIAEGRITDNCFTVQGVLSGSDMGNQNTYVSLDGTSGYLVTELAQNFSERSLTMEGLFKLHDLRETPIFAHGNDRSALELGLLPDGRLQIRFNDQVLTSTLPCDAEIGSWNHLALVYDTIAHTVTAYCNAKPVITELIDDIYAGTGHLVIGSCMHSTDQHLFADVATFRVWNYAMTDAQLQSVRSRMLTGSEYGLLACYNMDRGRGTVIEDKSRGVHLMMKGGATWTLPAGHCLHLDADKHQYAELRMPEAHVTDQSDWTLQFWFRTQQKGEATLLTTGEGDMVQNHLTISLNEQGHLRVKSFTSTLPYNDGNWHAVGIAVSRAMAYTRIYVDGALLYFDQSENFAAPQGVLYAGVLPQHDSRQTTYDHYLTGDIDEVQYWNLYRTQRQMEDEFHLRRDTTEVGLQGYWPMQQFVNNQGRQEMDTTLMNLASPTHAAGARFNGADFNTTPAPTSEARPKDNLQFDYVTSDKGIQINLLDKADRLQNAELTITVDRIYDLNGNALLSPVTWNVAVQQNRIYWTFSVIDEEMMYYDSHSFSNYICNRSGASTNYELSNLPSWLSVDKPDGRIAPNDVETIKFTVDPGLAIGTYTEVIYLTTTDGIRQPMHLNLLVRGDAPQWEDKYPHAAYSLNVFAQMHMDGTLSNDENDLLAAFIGKDCVGVARTQYVRQLDMYYALLTIHLYNAEKLKNQPITFRMWDASTGKTYVAHPSQEIKPLNGEVYGSPSAPVLMKGAEERVQIYNLHEGWNWLSFPLAMDAGDSLKTVLGGKAAGWVSNDEVKSLTRNAVFAADLGRWKGPLQTLSNDSLYLVTASKMTSFMITGTELNPLTHPLAIQPGWNWISYLPTRNLLLTQALAGYPASDGDVIRGADGFAMYVESVGKWIGSLTYMEPGCGYMLHNTASDTRLLYYPSTASSLNIHHMPAVTRYPHVMSLFVAAPDSVQNLRVMVGDEVVEPVYVTYADRRLAVVQLSAEANTAVHFRAVVDGQTVIANEHINYVPQAVVGTPNAPVQLHFGANDAAATVTEGHETGIYTILGLPVTETEWPGFYIINNKTTYVK